MTKGQALEWLQQFTDDEVQLIGEAAQAITQERDKQPQDELQGIWNELSTDDRRNLIAFTRGLAKATHSGESIFN